MTELVEGILRSLPPELAVQPRVRDAAMLAMHADRETLNTQIELTRIPAPPFREGERGVRMAELFREAGLVRVRTDAAGNVLAELPDAPAGPPLVLSAHLDTVFPEGTDITVVEEGDRILGPGIADDGRGLAVILAVARALVAAGLTPPRPLLLAATVGEEGVGDLRGVRELFSEGREGREALGFISVDGAGLDQLVSVGLGSRRYRVAVRGPGGHSWSDWGLPNPIHALGRAVGALSRIQLPTDPVATLSVGRWGGGTSVNAIPAEAWVEVDIRSASPQALADVDRAFKEAVDAAVTAINGEITGSDARLTYELSPIGARPAGETSWDSDLVRSARAATEALGVQPEISVASTDSNVPMSLGIPAVTMGGGGKAGGMHTLDEWYENDQGSLGVLRVLFTSLLALQEAA
jgi:acetylornithine deacetylase/succinyl-diaminopimelate desuccinylase-like protein